MITRRTLLAASAAGLTLPLPAFAVDGKEVLEMSMGNPDAKVTVIEYASFTCPHCANFHENTFPDLKANYIEPGKINFIYREIYFDRFGLWAGMMARCAGPEKYFGIADLLYKRQAEWSRGAPAENMANMRTIGKIAGMTDETLDACFQDQAKAEALVETFRTNASRDEVTSTPTLIVNGTQHGNMSYSKLADIIDAQLGE